MCVCVCVYMYTWTNKIHFSNSYYLITAVQYAGRITVYYA